MVRRSGKERKSRTDTEKRGRGRPNSNSDAFKPCSPEFFKVFLPPRTSQNLLIPPDYIKHFGRTIRERIILKDLSGRNWHVTVERTQDGVYVKDGWQNFVNYHSLKVGEFLVFRYDGGFSFVVKVFSTTGCKKETCSAEKIAKRVKIEENADEEIEEKPNLVKHDDPCGNHSLLRGREQTPLARGVVDPNKPKLEDVPSKRQEASTSEGPHLPSSPCFISILSFATKYHVNIPRVVMKQNIHLEPEMVLRDLNGKKWPVTIQYSKDGRTYIGKGWKDFRRDHNLGLQGNCKFTFDSDRRSKTIDVEVLPPTPRVLRDRRR